MREAPILPPTGRAAAPPSGGAVIGPGKGSGPGADLVEAVRAVHRPVVAREERHERLSAALGADGGVHLALAPVGPSGADAEGAVLLGDGAAALAALRLVDEPLAGVELLLAAREDEVHAAVPTADGLVGVHLSQCLLFSHARSELDVRGLRAGPRSACELGRGSSELGV